MKTTIRRAEREDLPALTELLHQLFSLEQDFTVDEEKQKRGLSLLLEDKTSHILVAETSGRVIGMCSLLTFISTAEGGSVGIIEDFVVNEKYRGQSTGTRLMEAAINEAEKLGLLRLQLLADKENSPALEFYAKRNWKPTSLVALRYHGTLPPYSSQR
jgi:N-acetylglutamate synthase-like GNAT family acetyltransferase